MLRSAQAVRCAADLPGLLLAFGTLDMALENFANARLISRAGALEPSQHLGIEPQRNKLLGIVGFRTPAPNQLAATTVVSGSKPLFGQFGNLVIFVRLHDMAVNFLQIASQSGFFRGHLLSSSR